jgi:hypothetical protein
MDSKEYVANVLKMCCEEDIAEIWLALWHLGFVCDRMMYQNFAEQRLNATPNITLQSMLAIDRICAGQCISK